MADGDESTELESVVERFKTAYLTACERQDTQPLESLLEQLENANSSGETFLSIQVRGNTPEHFDSRLKDGDLEAIVGALQASPGVLITELDLSWNLIGDDSVAQLCEYLKTDEQIVTVNLAYNEIGENGAKAIADALSVNRTIRHLILSGNKVGDNGGLALAEMMLKNYSLRTAGLSLFCSQCLHSGSYCRLCKPIKRHGPYGYSVRRRVRRHGPWPQNADDAGHGSQERRDGWGRQRFKPGGQSSPSCALCTCSAMPGSDMSMHSPGS